MIGEGGRASLFNPETGAAISAKDEQDAIQNGLNAGMQFSRLKVSIIRKGGDELAWEATLGSDFSLNALKTPKIDKQDDDPDALWLEKLYLLGIPVNLLMEQFKRAER